MIGHSPGAPDLNFPLFWGRLLQTQHSIPRGKAAVHSVHKSLLPTATVQPSEHCSQRTQKSAEVCCFKSGCFFLRRNEENSSYCACACKGMRVTQTRRFSPMQCNCNKVRACARGVRAPRSAISFASVAANQTAEICRLTSASESSPCPSHLPMHAHTSCRSAHKCYTPRHFASR